MSCEVGKEKADLYLDGELGQEERRLLDAHLHDCSSCVAELASGMELKRMVRLAGHRFEPSPEFRRRVERQIAAPRQRRPWLTGWMMQVAALAAVAVVAVWVSLEPSRLARPDAFSEVADLHVATLASANPVDVISSDRHTVKPWFQGRLPFSFNVPELNNAQYALIGGGSPTCIRLRALNCSMASANIRSRC